VRGISIVPQTNQEVADLSSDDIVRIMRRIGFPDDLILELGMDLHRTLAQSGAARVLDKREVEAVLRVSGRYVYITSRNVACSSMTRLDRRIRQYDAVATEESKSRSAGGRPADLRSSYHSPHPVNAPANRLIPGGGWFFLGGWSPTGSVAFPNVHRAGGSRGHGSRRQSLTLPPPHPAYTCHIFWRACGSLNPDAHRDEAATRLSRICRGRVLSAPRREFARGDPAGVGIIIAWRPGERARTMDNG
jgi:hypothetical protein